MKEPIFRTIVMLEFTNYSTIRPSIPTGIHYKEFLYLKNYKISIELNYN